MLLDGVSWSLTKDPRTDTDAEVTLAEMAEGYETDAGFTDPIFYESVIAVSRFEE